MRGTLILRVFANLAVFGMVVAMAGPARAARPEKTDQTTAEPFPDKVCDIPVMTTVSGSTILHIQDIVIPSTGEGSDDFFIGVIRDHLTITWTNADGVALVNIVQQTRQEHALVDNGDGTYTYTINGRPEVLRSGNKSLVVDVGTISFPDTFYLCDLSTDDDNYFINSEITGITGPHPDAESDFALFCDVVTEILG
jgi:hypothetical protein